MPIDPIEAFPPRWLNKDTIDKLLTPHGHNVTLKSIGYENVGAKEERALVWRFLEIKAGFICKRGHYAAAAELYGENTDTWIGKKVQVRRNPRYGNPGETGLTVLAPSVRP
jgi:hypothetical protein